MVANHVSYVDALVITAARRRPIQFVMITTSSRRLRWPVFRQMKAIPIAGAKEDPAMMAQAFERVKQTLAEGDAVGIFPEGKLTKDGEMNPSAPASSASSRNWCPVAADARGLGQSHQPQRQMKVQADRGFFNRIELVGDRNWRDDGVRPVAMVKGTWGTLR